MNENPDLAAERDRNKIIFKDDLDRRLPAPGDLRFIARELTDGSMINMLQRYEWSHELGYHEWFDVPLVTEFKIGAQHD